MKRNLNQSSGGRRILGVPDVGILASQIISETAIGDSGPGLLYDEALANTGKQLRVATTSYSGTEGALFVYENGSILIDGEADGSYVIAYDWYADNVLGGSDTATVYVGAVNASAGAGTGTSTGSGTGGTATGGVASSAGGGTATSVGSGSGGAATGGAGSSGSASGGTGTSTGSGTGGEATGEVGGSASVTGGTGTGSGAGSGGDATGQIAGVVAGGTGAGTGTGTGGDATGTSANAYVPGGSGTGYGTGYGGAVVQDVFSTPPDAIVTVINKRNRVSVISRRS